jgi:hypothetical protein
LHSFAHFCDADAGVAGILSKVGNGWRSWKRRLFSLKDDGSLTYSDMSSGKTVLRGTIVVQGVRDHTAAKGVKWPVANMDVCFVIVSSLRHKR